MIFLKHSDILSEYCQRRLSQLEQNRPVLEFFGVEGVLSRYVRPFQLIIQELEGRNDDETKRKNVLWYLESNHDALLFLDDILAILNDRQPVLPDNLFEIREYYAEQRRLQQAELERQRMEEHRKRDAEIAAEIEERKRKRREELAAELGIKPEALAKLA